MMPQTNPTYSDINAMDKTSLTMLQVITRNMLRMMTATTTMLARR
jgi:hypothetical protein